MSEVYEGRLLADGYGNLLADEGSRTGDPVAYEDGKYVFLSSGDKSHNARHEKNVLEMVATTDDTAGTPDNPTKGQEHHWDVVDKPQFDADSMSAKSSGHTAAYTKESN